MKRRSWLAPQVVQTSAMDCGPATLKSLLQGHGIDVSYGRLREACQTDVDGTSIDAMEEVARQLGLDAEQVLIPADHAVLHQAGTWPAIVVTRLPEGASHFVLAWRRVGPWVQVMDPAAGRRWMRLRAWQARMLSHEVQVDVDTWRAWALSPDGWLPLQQRLRQLGVGTDDAAGCMASARDAHAWFGLAALDACTRFVQALIDAQGVDRGAASAGLLQSLLARTLASPDDIHQLVPMSYWRALPQALPEGGLQLRVQGVVLVRVKAHLSQAAPEAHDTQASSLDPAALTPEVRHALTEPPARPLQAAWRLMGEQARRAPWALATGALISALALGLEMLLFRGLLDVQDTLSSPHQRLVALCALLAFGLLLVGMEWAWTREAMRWGRQLDVRLRMALQARMSTLEDAHLRSRPVADMAERGHSLHASRQLPGLLMQATRTLTDLAATVCGLAWLDARTLPWALTLALVASGLPCLWFRLLAEHDMRVRQHASALHHLLLDALQGLVPIRAHAAERAVRRQHEGLITAWARAQLTWVRFGLLADGLQAMLALSLALGLLWGHTSRVGGATGADLLLIYWTLKLPALGQWLAQLVQQLGGQANTLSRAMEPLAVPADDGSATPSTVPAPTPRAPHGPSSAGVAIRIQGGLVKAGGHTLLDGIDLILAAGEHVAIVGPSGAGKSSLAAVLLGLHRLSQGQLHINDDAPSTTMPAALRPHTAWVDPAVQLWNGTLLDNLCSALPDTQSPELDGPLDLARLREMLHKLPQGLQTHLGDGGSLLSGGEGQRVRLARALMQAQVQLAVLDEPFRGLDRSQRQQLLREVRQWWRHSTLVCVTHDLSETAGFDRVLVIDQGQVVEDGAPQALMQQASRYRELLEAEQTLHTELWQQPAWRRLHLHPEGLRA
jgi:ABC-type bacteriocin/lantibiotic exporter with double-glycine peptidase domain